jgi:hypothetical protein
MRAEPQQDTFSFGPFRLAVNERLLMREGVPVELGGRALDVLIALVSRPNEVISKAELLAQVWPESRWKKAACAFTLRTCAKRWATGRVAHATSPHWRDAATASWRRSRDRAIQRGRMPRPAPATLTASCQAASPEWSGGPTTFAHFRNC